MKVLNTEIAAMLAVFATVSGVMLWHKAAQAQSCSMTANDISFGTIGSDDSGGQTGAGSVTVNCSGVNGSAPMNYCLVAYPSNGAAMLKGPRQMFLNGNSESYGLYFDLTSEQASGGIFGGGSVNKDYGAPVFGQMVSDGKGNATVTVPLGAKTRPLCGQPKGFYTNDYIIKFGGSQSIRPDPTDADGICGRSWGWNSSPSAAKWVGVSATVKQSCNIQVAQNMNFGAFSEINAGRTAQGQVSVYCGGDSYEIGIGRGNNSSDETGKIRYMEQTDGDGKGKLEYGLFQDSALEKPWGDIGSVNTLTDTGTGPSGTPGNCVAARKIYPVYGQITKGQPKPPYGHYEDTVIVTVKDSAE